MYVPKEKKIILNGSAEKKKKKSIRKIHDMQNIIQNTEEEI